MSMTGLFKSFFNKDDNSQPRSLDHPRDLMVGDIIKFQYMPQPELSNLRFQISALNTYDFEDRKLTEMTLKGNSAESIFMTVDETGDEAFLAFSRKINRNLVEQIFNLDEFADIFDTDNHTTINRQNSIESLEGWTTDKYIQEVFAEGGYYHKGDFRNKAIPENESDGEYFDYYMLIGNKRQFLIEAEVYDDAETDIILSVRRPLTDIEEMYPA